MMGFMDVVSLSLSKLKAVTAIKIKRIFDLEPPLAALHNPTVRLALTGKPSKRIFLLSSKYL